MPIGSAKGRIWLAVKNCAAARPADSSNESAHDGTVTDLSKPTSGAFQKAAKSISAKVFGSVSEMLVSTRTIGGPRKVASVTV